MPKKVTANGKTFTFDDNVSNDDIGHAIDDYFAANKTAPQQVQAPPAQQQSPTAEQAIAHFQNAIALGGAVTQKPQAQPEDNGGGVWSGGEQVQHQPNAANPLLYNELVETPQYQQAVKEHAAKQEEANRNYAANFDISKHQFENKAVPSGTAISYGVNDLANKIQQGAATDEEKRNYEFLKPIADKETNFINNKYKEEGIVNFGKTDAEQRGGKDAQLAQLADDYYKTLQEGKPTLGILDKIHSINPNWRYDDSQNNPQKAAQIDDLYKSSIIRYKMAQDKFKEAESKLHELQDNGAGIFSASKKLTGNYDDLSMSNDMLGGQFFPEVQQYNAAKQELAQAHQNAYALYRNAVLKEDIGGEHENQVAHQGFINKYVGEPLKNVIGGAAKGAANMLNMYGTGGGQSQFGLNPNIDVAQNLKQDYQQNNIAVPQNLKDAASKPISQSAGEIAGSLPIFLGKQAPMALALGAGMNLVGEAAGVGALEGEGGAIQQMLKSPDLATKMNGVIASSYLEGTKFALGSGKPEDFEMGMKYGLAGSLGGALTKIVANNKYLVELSKIAPKTAAILGGVGGQAAGTAAMLGSAEGLGFAKAGVDYMTNQTTFKEALKNAGIDTDNLSDYSKNLIAQFAVFGLSHGLAPIKEAKNEQSLARLKEAKDNMIKSGVPEHEAEQIVQAAQPHEEKPTQTEVPTETKINEPINEVKPIEVKANDTVDNALAETQQHDEQLKNNTYEPTDTQSEVVNSAIEETGNPPQDEAEQRKQLDIINTALTKGTESIGNQAANNPEGGSAAPESVGGETEGGQGNAAETEIGSVGVGGDKSILDSDVDLKGDKKGGYEREHLNHVKTELSKKDESKIAEVANELHPGNPEIAKGLIDFVKATIKIINSKLAKEVEENKKNGVPKNFSATTNEVTFGLKDLNSDDFFPKDLGGSDRFLKGNKYYSDAVHILKQIGYDINSPSNWMQSDARIRNAHNIQGALNFYKNFEGDNHFVRDIKKGILTATDAKTIIESAGLEVPKEIAEQSLKETPKAGSGGVVDVDFTAKGGNKVVDEKGNPITVYHVSNNPDIKVFKTEGTIEVVGNKNVPNHGAYFSPNKGKYKHKGEHEYAVNLKMANPFITTDQIYSAIITPEKFADLKAKGHDGVILMRNGKPDEYIVFDNSQIKQSFKENNLNQNTNEKANEVREIESRQGQPENERGQPIRGKERQEANAEKEKVGQGEATPQSSLPRSRKNRIELVKKSEPLDLRTAVLKFFIEGGKLHQDEVVTELGLGNRDKYNSGKKISSPTELISRNWMIDHEPIKAGEKRKTIDQQILGNPMFENYDPQKVRDMFIEVMTDHTQKDKMIDEYLHQQSKLDYESGLQKHYENTIAPPTPHEEMVYSLENAVHLTPEEQDLLPTLEDGIGNLTKEEQAHLLSLYDEWQNSRSIEEIRNEANELTQKIKDNEAELNRQAENLDNGNGINKRNAQAKPISETKIITTKPTDNATKEIKQQKSVPTERENRSENEADKTSSSNSVLGAEKGEEQKIKEKDAKKMSFPTYKNKYKNATLDEYHTNRTSNTNAVSSAIRDLSQSIKDDKTTKSTLVPPHLIAKGLDMLADAIDAGVNIKNAIADIVAKLTKEHEGVNGIELEKELLDRYNEKRNKDLSPKQLVVNGHNVDEVLKENTKYVQDLKDKLAAHYEKTNPELFNDKESLNTKLEEGVQKLKGTLVAERNRILNGGRNYLAEGKPEDAYKLFKANGMNDFEAEEALGKIEVDALTAKQRVDATKSVMKNLLDRVTSFVGERGESKTRAKMITDEIQKDIKSSLEKGQKLQDVDMAMHVYLDLQRNPEHLNEYLPKIEKGAKEGLAKFKEAKRIIDLSQNLTDKQKEVAQKIADTYKGIGEQAKEEGIINEVLDNYVGRTWDINGKAASENNFKFATSTRHSIERSLDTIIQGLANGMDLKYKGASTNLGVIMEELGNVIANRNFIEEGLKQKIDTGMKDANGKPIKASLFTTNSDQQGYKQIDNKNFRSYQGGNKVPIYAPEPIANSLNNILGTSTFKEGSIMKKIETYNAALKVLELSLSPFHAFQFGRRHFFGATHGNFADMNPIKAYKQGLEMIQKDPQFVLDLVKHGNVNLGITPEWSEMVIDHSTYLGKQMDKLSFTKAAKDGVLNFNKIMHNWLFNKFGTGLTLFDAKTEYERLSKVHPEMSHEEKMKVVGKFISNLYGNKNWDIEHGSFMQNKKNQSLLRQLFLAPNWTISNLALAKNAFNKGVEGELYRRMWAKTILKGLALSLTANAGFALMNENDEDAKKSFSEKFAGRYKRAYKNGLIHTLDVDITPLYHVFGGSPKKTAYLSTLGAFDEPLKAGQAATKTIVEPIYKSAKKIVTGKESSDDEAWKGDALVNYVGSKLSPVARMALEAALDKDWQGKQFKSIDELVDDYKQGGKNKFTLTKYEGKKASPVINPSQIPSYALHQVMGLVPISLTTGIQMMEGQKDGVEALMNLSGIGVKTMKNQEDFSNLTPEEKRKQREEELQQRMEEIARKRSGKQ